tara:strand:- start:215 stop:331 length:117 start_codon:yes stop_codon:yes gene_type:complete
LGQDLESHSAEDFFEKKDLKFAKQKANITKKAFENSFI